MNKASAVISGVIFTCLLVLPVLSQEATNPCARAEQKQLDFWVGEWKLTWPGPKGELQRGSNSIRRVLDGCVVEENFSGGQTMHLRGKSLSLFDARQGKWKQTWVDNEGGYLDFIGEYRDGRMILSRETKDRHGKKFLQRMVFKNIRPSQLDWSWERSEDGGTSWKVVWPIHYQRAE